MLIAGFCIFANGFVLEIEEYIHDLNEVLIANFTESSQISTNDRTNMKQKLITVIQRHTEAKELSEIL